MAEKKYVHGTNAEEQLRLARLNELTNDSYLEFLQPEGRESILEVGSGLGILSGTVAERYPEAKVVGLEFSAEQLAYPKKLLPNIRYVRGDAHRIPFPAGSFDLVYGRYILEHVVNAQTVTNEMFRVLKPGGRACVQENNALVSIFDPDCPRFDALWRQYVQLQDRFGGDPQVGKKLFAIFKKAGFTEIRLTCEPEFHHAGMPSFLPWVENMIGIVEASAPDMQKYNFTSLSQIDEGVAEARAFAERDDATALFYWNRACGIKV